MKKLMLLAVCAGALTFMVAGCCCGKEDRGGKGPEACGQQNCAKPACEKPQACGKQDCGKPQSCAQQQAPKAQQAPAPKK